jgi:hypothetical protein
MVSANCLPTTASAATREAMAVAWPMAKQMARMRRQHVGAGFPVPLASTAAIDPHGCLAIRVIAIVGTGSIRRLCAAVRSSAKRLQ